MTLTFPDGERFAIGATPYQYRPATAHETTPRIILEVEIDGIQTEAVMDTGGIYLVCSPWIARLLHVEAAVEIVVEDDPPQRVEAAQLGVGEAQFLEHGRHGLVSRVQPLVAPAVSPAIR